MSKPPAPSVRLLVTNAMKNSGLRNRSTFNLPISTNHHVELFKSLVLRDLDSMEQKKVNPWYTETGINTFKKRRV